MGSLVQRKICHLYFSKDGLKVPNIEMQCHALHISFLDWLYSQDDETGSFWKEMRNLWEIRITIVPVNKWNYPKDTKNEI